MRTGCFRWLSLLAAGLAACSSASAQDSERAREIVAGKCFICHGLDGESSSSIYPRLAGQHAAYIARQLADYRSGKRKNDTMQSMVADLQPEDYRALGLYFESRKPAPHPVENPELAAVGRFLFVHGNEYSKVAPCAGCHGPGGHGTETLPRLAGQRAAYIENQLKLFNRRERTNDNAIMHSIASQLTELEIKALAAYVSGLE